MFYNNFIKAVIFLLKKRLIRNKEVDLYDIGHKLELDYFLNSGIDFL